MEVSQEKKGAANEKPDVNAQDKPDEIDDAVYDLWISWIKQLVKHNKASEVNLLFVLRFSVSFFCKICIVYLLRFFRFIVEWIFIKCS